MRVSRLLGVWLPLACAGPLCAQQPGDPCRAGAEARRRGDLASAEKLLERCIAARPAAVAPYLELCAVYQLAGRADDLHRVALAGLKRFPGEKRFHLTVGLRAARDRRYERAIEVLAAAARRWPDDPALREHLAGAHIELGKKLLDDGRTADAERNLRRGADLAPDDPEARLNLGRALHNLNRSIEAVAELSKVVETREPVPLAFFNRGLVLHALGDYDRAIADFDAQIARDPEYPPSYLFRGLARIARAEWSAALTDLEIAARRMPDNPRAQFALARTLAQLGRREAAESAFRKTIALDAKDPAPVRALARLLVDAGRGEEAESLFRKAAALERAERSAAPGEIRFEPARPAVRP